LEPDPEKQLKDLDFIDIYAALEDNERTRYQRDYPQEAKTMSQFAERFREEGMQQGVQQGMQQGEALVLERLLRLKIGTLSEAVRRRIEQAKGNQSLVTALSCGGPTGPAGCPSSI